MLTVKEVECLRAVKCSDRNERAIYIVAGIPYHITSSDFEIPYASSLPYSLLPIISLLLYITVLPIRIIYTVVIILTSLIISFN